MNNIFNIKRFGKVLSYDMHNAKNNFGLSLLICGMLPIISVLIHFFFYFTFGVALNNGEHTETTLKYTVLVSLFIAPFIATLLAPTKTYGFLTDRRSGTDYLMLPASTLEKWLSMILELCVVVPIILIALLLASDTFIGICFPQLYPNALLLNDNWFASINEVIGQDLHISFTLILILNWIEYVMMFLLGAICFKKGKVAKTILSIMLLSTILSTLTICIFGVNFNIKDYCDTPEAMFDLINKLLTIGYAAILIPLFGLTFLRLKTIKH